jgi:hypothetical protein
MTMRANDMRAEDPRRWRMALVAVAAVLAVSGAVGQELEPSKIEVAKLGPQVGEVVPDFSLPDQNGTIWTRSSIMGPQGAMLVFVRSADW